MRPIISKQMAIMSKIIYVYVCEHIKWLTQVSSGTNYNETYYFGFPTHGKLNIKTFKQWKCSNKHPKVRPLEVALTPKRKQPEAANKLDTLGKTS